MAGMSASATSLSPATTGNAPLRHLRRWRLRLVAIALTAMLGYGGNEIRDTLSDRQEAIDDALRNADTLLISLDEHLTRTVQAAEAMVRLAGDRIEAELLDAEFNASAMETALVNIHQGTPQLGSMGFIDSFGSLALASVPRTPFNVKDRDYFLAHRQDPSRAVRIGQPTVSRATGKLIVPLTRRVNHPDGGFAGVVLGTLDANYFDSFYGRLDGGTRAFAVFGADAILLARVPHDPRRVGTSYAQQALFRDHVSRNARGQYWRSADQHGPDRYVVYRRTTHNPFVLVLTFEEDAILAAWRAKLPERMAGIGGVLLLIALAASLLYRGTYRQERLARSLQESREEFRDFAEASSDWMWETDANHRFTRFVGKVDRIDDLKAQYIGRSRFEIIDPVQPPPGWLEHVETLKAQRPFRDFIYRRVSPDGVIRYVKTSGIPVFGPKGDFRGYRGTASDVTEILQAQEQAAALRQRLDTAIETLHEGFILFDSQDRFVLCNGKYRELYAKSADLLVPGAHYESILRQAVSRGQFPHVDGRAERWIKGALAHHHIKVSTRQRLLPNNRWVEVREVKLEDGGSVGIHIDITETKRAEERLRENEERLRGIAANMPGAVLEFTLGDDDLIRHLYVSERIQEITGYTAQEMMDEPRLTVRVMGEEVYAESVKRLREASRTMSPLEREYPLTRRDGTRRWARSSSRPRRLPGGEVVWDVLLLDATDQKAAEARRQELENQLRHLQRIEAVGTLAGGMAHEINNKLVPIVTFSELMLMTAPEDSPNRKALHTIHDAAGRIRDLVARILSMSRSETPGTACIRLKEAVANTMELLRATLRPNVRLTLEAETDSEILGDPSQIEQVLVNLCTNAAHAIGPKQGEISIRLDEREMTGASGGLPAGRYARLRVRDTGVGMTPQIQERIFEPFFTTKGLGEGTGLGLSIVHGIVSSHRGRIRVDSEPGRGTTFTVLLPLAAANDSGEPRLPGATTDNPLRTSPESTGAAPGATHRASA